MQLRKTISSVPFHFDVCVYVVWWTSLCWPHSIRKLHQQSFNVLLLLSRGPYQNRLAAGAKFLLHKFKQPFTITRDLTTKEDTLDETPGSHQRNYRIVCKVRRRIYLLTLTVHFPMAWASLTLEFCCIDVWSCEWQGFVWHRGLGTCSLWRRFCAGACRCYQRLEPCEWYNNSQVRSLQFQNFFCCLHAHDFLVLKVVEISDGESLLLFLYSVLCRGLVIQMKHFLPDCLILSVNCSLLFYD